MMDFTYNGKKASAFGIRISSVDTYGAPERIVQEYQIPGLVPKIIAQDQGIMGTYTRQYECVVMRDRDLEETTAKIKAWLMADGDYHRLEDTYQTEVFRMARYVGPFSVEWVGSARRSIRLSLSFSCQPQLWYKTGAEWYDIPISAQRVTLTNPGTERAYPIVRFNWKNVDENTEAWLIFDAVSGSRRGSVKCLKPTTGFADVIYADCETYECYDSNGKNANALVTFSGDVRVDTSIMLQQNDFSEIKVGFCPRWWRW